jgi:hypothetical protein
MPRRRRRTEEEEAPQEPEVEATEVEVVDEEEETQEEAPAPKKRARRVRKPDPEPEEDEEEEEEAPAPKKARRRASVKKEETQVAKKKETQLAKPMKGLAAGFGGEDDADDIEMPTIKIVHPMSDDFEEFVEHVGEFLWSGELPLGKEINVILFNVDRKWQEITEYDPDSSELPEIFNSREDAREAGCKVKRLAVIDMLIECPEKLDGEEMIELDGVPFFIARWYNTTYYRKVIGPLRNHLAKQVDQTVYDRWYTIRTERRKGKSLNFNAILKPSQDTLSPELKEAVATRFATQ